jgi:hypothetical protein
MSHKALKATGWVLTIILALLFGMSAFLKLTQNEAALAQAATIGFDAGTYQAIGILEVISLLLFILPRTGVLGSLLLIAYMGGAIVTHLQHQQPIFMAVLIQILVWITALVRFPELRQRLFATSQQTQKV